MNELFKLFSTGAISASLAVFGAGCEGESSPSVPAEHHADDHHDSDEHHDGEMHGDEVHDHDGDDMHNHDDEVPLGTATIGDMEVEAFQGHGETEPGKEMHLVVKLPYNDSGASEVRAWIGTEDRFASVVGKGEYASSHDDYDIHAIAPDPLPEDAAWWIEVTQPDGTVHTGSIAFQ